ncbi:hypothetical protein LTR95_003494 [Oleoguttula sp. CCFEE 5521]
MATIMRSLILACGLATLVKSQTLTVPPDLTSFADATGTRSLWIPFFAVESAQASILETDTVNNQTVYVIACATNVASCAVAPNITLTEGPTNAEYSLVNSNG